MWEQAACVLRSSLSSPRTPPTQGVSSEKPRARGGNSSWQHEAVGTSGQQQQRLGSAESREEAPGPALRPASPHLWSSCRGQAAPCEGRDPWATGPARAWRRPGPAEGNPSPVHPFRTTLSRGPEQSRWIPREGRQSSKPRGLISPSCHRRS